MFKSFVIGKKGYGNIEFRQYDDGHLTVYMNKTEIPMDRDHMVAFKKAYIAEGWEIKVEKKPEKKQEEKKVAAPRKPHWDFGEEGFNRSEYDRIAREKGWTWCDGRGRIHVQKKRREEIYVLMGGQYVE